MVQPMSPEESARAVLARATRRTFTLADRGIEIAALEWGDDGPLLLLHHANGFCKGTWGLVAGALGGRCRVVAIDARGHGDSSKPEHADAYAWDRFAEDLLAVAERLIAEHGGRPIALGVGHSFGGTSMIGAAARRADCFERLLLVDPVVPAPAILSMPPERIAHFQRLVDGAPRRRASWPSRATARAWCAERAFFARWRPEAIELYLLDGMRERPDGSLELKCPGTIEGAVFSGSASIDVFALARRVHTPTLILRAQRGDFPRVLYDQLVESISARVDVVEVDAGHLIPMERPDLVVGAADQVLP